MYVINLLTILYMNRGANGYPKKSWILSKT